MAEQEQEKTFDDYFEEAMNGDQETDEGGQEKNNEKETESNDQNQETAQEETQDQGIFNAIPEEEKSVDNSNEDPTEKKTDSEPDYKTLYEKELQRTKSWEGRIKAANERAKKAEERIAALEAQQQEPRKEEKRKPLPDGINGKEDEIIQGFIEEFPDLEKPIKAMAAKIADQIITERLKDLQPQVKNLQTSVQEAAVERHFKAIEAAHPDWKEIAESGRLDTWIEAQPTFIKDSLINIKERGNAAQIIEMFNAFKRSVKQNQETPKQEQRPYPPQRAKHLIAVPAQSGGPKDTKGAEPNKDDFDSAWKEAVGSK